MREERARLLRWSAGVLAVAAFVGFLLAGANRPHDPRLVPAGRTPISGFGEIAYRIDPGPAGGGVTAQRCALLADTAEQQELGLMHRTDLAGHDGMLFRFPSDTTTEFYMKDTLLPLSIAWFDSHGSFVSATDMDPCPSQVQCPTFAAVAPYRYALEVLRGQLAGQGVGPGSHLVVGGACRCRCWRLPALVLEAAGGRCCAGRCRSRERGAERSASVSHPSDILGGWPS